MDDRRDPFRPLDMADMPASAPTEAERPAEWHAVLPAPRELPQMIRHRLHGAPSRVWRYLDRSGALLFAVCRFDTRHGKVVLPYCCGADGWRWKAPAAPRPLFGLDRLAARPDASVLLVEGEKAVDAAAGLFPEHVAMCWPGGAKAVGKADWSVLGGRAVTIWPDHDKPGAEAAGDLVKVLRKAGAARIVTVRVPDCWPEGWDVADPPPDRSSPDKLRGILAAAEVQSEVLRLAALDNLALAMVRREVARRLKLTVADLMAAVKAARRETHRAEGEDTENDAAPAVSPPGLNPDPRGRADLFVNAADLPDTAADLARLLATVPHLFERGGPARLAFDAQRGGLVAEPLTLNAVVNEAHGVARPWRYRRERDGTLTPEAVTLPERVAHLYLAMRGQWGLRPLDGIAAAPLLTEDGGFRVADGYDSGTRMWCERMPDTVVPEAPTRADAAAALRRLRDLFRTFAFADAMRVTLPGCAVPVVDTSKDPDVDESTALVGLLTAVCRPSLRLAPALLVRAPAFSGAGTGKGLLVRILCAIAYGLHPRAMTAGGTAEELDKRVVAALMGAEPVVFLDNVNGTALRSDALASAVTERPAYVRPLGRSVTVPLNPTALVSVTGNGLVLSEDLARRFLTVELDAGVEDPEARDFRGDLLREAMERRGELLRDALTIWRWGRLNAAAIPPGRVLGSFQDWGRWCRDPLLALGCADPATRVNDAKANDPRRRHIGALLGAWWERHHETPVKVADLHDDVRAVADPAGRGRQYLASAIAKLEGTRVAGFVLIRARTTGKWSPDLYALRRTAAEAGAVHHRVHRGRRESEAGSLGETMASGGGQASAAFDHNGNHREGMGAQNLAENQRSTPMPPMTPMPAGGEGGAWEDVL